MILTALNAVCYKPTLVWGGLKRARVVKVKLEAQSIRRLRK